MSYPNPQNFNPNAFNPNQQSSLQHPQHPQQQQQQQYGMQPSSYSTIPGQGPYPNPNMNQGMMNQMKPSIPPPSSSFGYGNQVCCYSSLPLE